MSHAPLVLAIDGSIVGRGCITFMINVVYKQRALRGRCGKKRKGHFPERAHVELMNRVQQRCRRELKSWYSVMGKFDGIDLQALINHCQWQYVLRTNKSTTLSWEGEQFCFDDVADKVMVDALLKNLDELIQDNFYLECKAESFRKNGNDG